MKIQLDTTYKKIRIEEEVNLGEFVKILAKLLPNNEWKQYKIESAIIAHWFNPFVIQPYYVQPYFTYTTVSPVTTYRTVTGCNNDTDIGSTTTGITVNANSLLNFEVN